MIGAAVLLGALVLVVPAVLDGAGTGGPNRGAAAPEPPIDLRTHTIQLDGDARRPPVPRAVVEPLPPEPAPAPAATAGDVPAAEPVSADPGASAPDLPPAVVPTPIAAVPAPPPAPTPAAPAAPVAAGDWVVQLGSFAKPENAERLAAAVRERGFTAEVSDLRGGSGRLFRVRVGPAASRADAERLARDLTSAGYPGTVARR